MRYLLLAILALTTACSWSNSLYHARRLSGSALKAEREERSFEAGSLWGRAAVKADSAFARSPEGSRGAEALWLRGRALAHMGSCDRGMPLLERSQVSLPDAGWGDDLTLELARCRLALGDPILTIELLQPLLQNSSGRVRDAAREVSGRAMLAMGDWDDALQLMASDDSREGEWLRAMALARLGQDTAALGLLEPRIEQADTLTRVLPLVRDIRRIGSAAYDLCNFAAGRLDAYYERGLQPWDFAAGLLIAREAGAAVVGRDEDTAPGTPFLFAADPALVEQLRSAVLGD